MHGIENASAAAARQCATEDLGICRFGSDKTKGSANGNLLLWTVRQPSNDERRCMS